MIIKVENQMKRQKVLPEVAKLLEKQFKKLNAENDTLVKPSHKTLMKYIRDNHPSKNIDESESKEFRANCCTSRPSSYSPLDTLGSLPMPGLNRCCFKNCCKS